MSRAGRVILALVAAVLLATVVAPATAGAEAVYVVAPYGRDEGAGNVNDPWRTIEAAVSRLRPGDTLLVRGGEYTSPYGPGAPVDISGVQASAAQPIRIAAFPGERPLRRGSGWQVFRVFQSSYITIEGFDIVGTALTDRAPTAGIEINESHHIVVRGNYIHDTGGSGVSAIHSDHVLVEANHVWGATKWSPYQTSGINFFESVDSNSGPPAYGFTNVIMGNFVYDNETLVPGPEGLITDGNCIIIDSNRSRSYRGSTAILNNICARNGGRGVNVNRSDNVFVVNNTLLTNVNRLQQPGAELNATYASNVIFRNNLVAPNQPDRGLLLWDVQNVTTDSNLYVAASPPHMGPGDWIVPSLPWLPGAIPEVGSAATDAGNPDSAPPVDAFGNPRKGRPDAGAVER